MADEIDDFDTAFAEVVAELEAPPAAPPAAPPTPSATPPVAPPTPPVAPPTPPVAPPTPPAAPPAAPPTPPAAPPAAPPTPPEAPPAAPPTPPEAPPAAPPTAPPTPPQAPTESPEQKAARETFEASIRPYEPTTEETSALAKFKEDFPNEALAVEARLKSVDRDINARVYQAVQNILSQVDPRLRSVESTVTATTQEQHFAQLHQAHPDYDQVIEKVPAWIKTLPSYAQAGAQAVYDGGTTQEVLSLVTEFKKANNMVAPTPPAPPPPPAPPKPDGSDLAPVSSRRPLTAPKGQADPNDFDGAFAEAAAELG